MRMNRLRTTLSFFGNPQVDRHRLLQGKWQTYRIDCLDGDLVSANPMEILTAILADELRGFRDSDKEAVIALIDLTNSAVNELDDSARESVTSSFWFGFRYVAGEAAKQLSLELIDVERSDIDAVIESAE